MVVFGLSRSLVLSLAALAVSGFVDMISVNIRSTTVALVTPNELRGRVNAVEMVFISASNELGAFESGAAAALIGAVPAVVAGGALTIVIAALWPRLFPRSRASTGSRSCARDADAGYRCQSRPSRQRRSGEPLQHWRKLYPEANGRLRGSVRVIRARARLAGSSRAR